MADADNTLNPSADNVAKTTIPNMHPEDCLLDVSIGLRLLTRSLYGMLEEPHDQHRLEEMWWISQRIEECFAEGMREYNASRGVCRDE